MTDDQQQKQFQPLENICELSLTHTFFRRLAIVGDDQHWRQLQP